MSEIKSLADQLRNRINQPPDKPVPKKTEPARPENHGPPLDQLVKLLQAYDNSDHKSMVHVRFDAGTAQTLTHFKMATGVDLTRLIVFATKQFIEQHPEIREIIKHYFQNLQL